MTRGYDITVRLHFFAATLISCMLAGGCERDDKIVVYNAPKEPARGNSPAATAVDGAGTTDASIAQPQPTQADMQWTAPQGWKQLPGDGQMRFASFAIWPDHPEIQATVVPLGAEAADTLPNVNRWEKQVGLPETKPGDIARVVKRLTVGDLDMDTVDLTSPESANPRVRLLAAILPSGGKTWFFKLQGPAELIGPQAANFTAFLKSIHVGGDPIAPPAGQAVASGTPASAGGAGATWDIPQGWQAEPDKPMRVANYKAGDAELIITQFGKDNFGGMLANINRWRGQASLEPVADENTTTADAIQVNNREAQLYDFVGGQFRVRVAMVIDNDTAWFFKLIGPVAAVEQQNNAFNQFLKSVKFGEKK